MLKLKYMSIVFCAAVFITGFSYQALADCLKVNRNSAGFFEIRNGCGGNIWVKWCYSEPTQAGPGRCGTGFYFQSPMKPGEILRRGGPGAGPNIEYYWCEGGVKKPSGDPPTKCS